MTGATPMALNRGSIEGTLAAARRCREEIANAGAAAEMWIADIDPGLREEVARERRGLIRSEVRGRIGEALARARALRETVTALRGLNSRVAALRRARFSSADGENTSIGSFWLQQFALMDPGENADVIRERATGPGGAAVVWLGHLAARGKVAAIEDEGERRAAAARLDEAIRSVPTECDELGHLLDAALAEVGQAEIEAERMAKRPDPGRVLRLAREHRLQDPRESVSHPAAAGVGGEAA